MARSLDAILSELNARSDPQRQTILNQISAIPQAQQAEEAGLQAKLSGAFDDILSGARQRGLGFSGIPLAEQSKYAATDYAPAVARVRQSFGDRKASLEDSLNSLGSQNYQNAYGIYNSELDNEYRNAQLAEQRRQFDLGYALDQRKLAQSGGSGGFSLSGGGGQQAAAQRPAATIARKSDGGFAFSNAQGQPISAFSYAKQTGTDIRDVLQQMGSQGDKYAATVYNQLASDPFFGKGNQTYDQKIFKAYSPIFWGAY